GFVLTEMVAVSPEGRITPGTPGLYSDEHGDEWRQIVKRLHGESDAKVMLQLGHAGPRGSTRPRREGVDRALREGGWPLLAASAIAFAPSGHIPREMTVDDMDATV